MKRLKSNETPNNVINHESHHNVTCLLAPRSCTFALVRWPLGTERKGTWGSRQLLKPLKAFDGPYTWLSEAMALSQWVPLCWWLTIHQHYVSKLPQNRALRNQKFVLRLSKRVSKAPFGKTDSHRSISWAYALFRNILSGSECDIDNLHLLEAISVTQNQSE